jgi:hypothetical protein
MRGLLLIFAVGAQACGVREEGLMTHVTVQVTPEKSGARYDTATLAIERLELSACREVRWWQQLNPISVAWAHGDELAASPAQRSLVSLTLDTPQLVGTIYPPPGAYCALQLHFAPSTIDARSQGTTLLLEGALDGAPLLKLSTRELKVEVPLDHETLDATRRTLELRLLLTAPSPMGADDDILEAAVATLRAESPGE